MQETSTSADAGIPLFERAHARAGDKGNTLNISVFVFDPQDYDWLVRELTETRIRERFAARRPKAVHRYLLPRLGGMNIVLEEVLEGGVNASAALDRHGKTLGYHLLGMTLPRH
ncbi:hypothetical protein [Kushneria phosphatilytica]|uniref:AtuA-like ferredoxin-fold domain-containing protein n=1 Tax=Kushneria phosphatilytica TaxID=657387 RepID=A0A1S1NRB7_9GAMM|nr:hypothetical protein [Kushneria phosphatilytica]OHV08447.1 hypothetical protein BH688_14185 [Kushneria phosphatilytica]QEL09875.1 hypothetical protein FY550_01150 [Kushneria phosphatilytica]